MLVSRRGVEPQTRAAGALNLVLPHEPLNFDFDVGRDVEACPNPSEIACVDGLMRLDGLLRYPLLKPCKVERACLAVYDPAVAQNKGMTTLL